MKELIVKCMPSPGKESVLFSHLKHKLTLLFSSVFKLPNLQFFYEEQLCWCYVKPVTNMLSVNIYTPKYFFFYQYLQFKLNKQLLRDKNPQCWKITRVFITILKAQETQDLENPQNTIAIHFQQKDGSSLKLIKEIMRIIRQDFIRKHYLIQYPHILNIRDF